MRPAKRRRHLHSLEYFERPLLAELSRRRVTQNDAKQPFKVVAIALDSLTYNESRALVIPASISICRNSATS